jgi:hypothetical protein
MAVDLPQWAIKAIDKILGFYGEEGKRKRRTLPYISFRFRCQSRLEPSLQWP